MKDVLPAKVSTPVTVRRPTRRVRPIAEPKLPSVSLIQKGRILVIVIAFISWEVLSRWGILDPFFWSSPSAVAANFVALVQNGKFLTDISFTFQATILGFILGTVLGAVIGLSFWWSRTYAEIAEPYLVTLQALPKLALAPILIIAFGIGLSSKVAIAILLTVTVTAIAAYSGVRSVDHDLQRMLYSLGASRWQVFTKVVVPWSMPWIFSSLRMNIGLALTGAIVGEYISSQHGLGHVLMTATMTFDMGQIWVAVLTLSVMSMVMYWFVSWIESRLSQRFGFTPSDAV
ncbi:MAG: ABC transporter permease [Elainellaceae cyanobacterium]